MSNKLKRSTASLAVDSPEKESKTVSESLRQIDQQVIEFRQKLDSQIPESDFRYPETAVVSHLEVTKRTEKYHVTLLRNRIRELEEENGRLRETNQSMLNRIVG